MKSKGSTLILVLTTIVFAVAMTLAGLSVFMKYTGRVIVMEEEEKVESESEDQNYTKFKEMDSFIQESYLGAYDRNDQMDEVFRTMIDSLGDQYSNYLSKEEQLQLKMDVNSLFTGTGIVFVKNDAGEGFVITEVIEGGPAYSVGIREGDIILSVDGKTYDDDELMTEAIKGESGSAISLEIQRGSEKKDYSVVRGDVQGASVESRILEDDVAYIRLRSFGEDTFKLFEAAISDAEGKCKSLILDLRNNGGGIFESGVQIADRIIPEGLITYSVDKDGNRTNYNSDDQKTSLKVVVLINANTASTSEMVAQALKVHGGCDIVGENSYGKGMMQEYRVFSDETAVNITVREFFGADESKIDGVGIKPTVRIANPSSGSKDAQLEKALELAKSTV